MAVEDLVFANFAEGPLLSSISSTATTISVEESAAFPFPSPTGSQYSTLTIFDGVNPPEIVHLDTNNGGGSLTVVRGREGTSARAWQAGARVRLTLTAASLGQFALAGNIETRDAITTTNIPAVMNVLRTGGYSTRGDGGHGLYVRVAVEPGHPGKVQSADGAWWELVPDGGHSNVRQFGAKGNGTTDDSAAIQNALTFAVASIGASEVHFPSGRYLMGSRVSESLGNNESLTLSGAGRYNTWLVAAAANTLGLIQITAAIRTAPVEVRDLGFEPGSDGSGTAFEYAGTAGGTQSKRMLTMVRCDFGPRDFASALSWNDPIKATGLFRPFLFDVKCWPGVNATTKQGRIIDLSDCYAFQVQNCYVNGKAAHGIYCAGTTEEAGIIAGNIINGADRGIEFTRTDNEPMFYVLDNHINFITHGVYIDGAKYITARNNLMYATGALTGTTPTDFIVVSGNGVQIEHNIYRDTGSVGGATSRRHVDLRGGSGVTEDIWIKEKALHASSDVAPFYIGPSVDSVELELPDFVPNSDFASYTASQLYTQDPTATNVVVKTATSVISVDPGATAGPIMSLYRNSPSPAVDDTLGTIYFYGEDDAGQKTDYALIRVKLEDPTNGSEEGSIDLFARDAGTLQKHAQFRNQGLALGGLVPVVGNGTMLANSDGYYIQRFGSAEKAIAYNGPIFHGFTAAQIADITHTVNTAGKVAGLTIRDITNNRLMTARGAAAGDPWDLCDGSLAVTPA